MTQGDIALKIAKAFVRQRYPLSAMGLVLKTWAGREIACGKISKELLAELPTVENPRLELFEDFGLSEEEERRVFGWKLMTIATSQGCTHQCTHCYLNSAKRVRMMPFAAVCKIAAKKLQYEAEAKKEWRQWIKHLRENKIIDLSKFRKGHFLRQADWDDIEVVAKLLVRNWMDYWKESSLIRIRPFPSFPIPFDILKKMFMLCTPVAFESMRYCVQNYHDSDPFDYRDYRFLHEDGSPADYGDVFDLMATTTRPVFISTAGWFDRVSTRALQKVVKKCELQPGLIKDSFRISASPFERHAWGDAQKDYFLKEMPRLLRESALLSPVVCVYHNRRRKKQTKLATIIADHLAGYMVSELGIPGRVSVDPISFRFGRATEMSYGKIEKDWDPDEGVDGISIGIDGQVSQKKDGDWVKIRRKKITQYEFYGQSGDRAEPMGIQLYKLEGGKI